MAGPIYADFGYKCSKYDRISNEKKQLKTGELVNER
jgi:hypothetical protein